MEIWDLKELKRDNKQDKLYNLFDNTINKPTSIEGFQEYIVEEDDEMRIDLVCNKIYGNINQIGFLLTVNDISNPLNIKRGDVIRYITGDLIDSYKVSPQDGDIAIEIAQANDKGTRKDPNREEFEKNNYSLPPNLQETPTPPFEIVGDTVVIGR